MLAYAKDSEVSFPMLEDQLRDHLLDCYVYKEWKPAFDAVFAADDDTIAAVTSVSKLMEANLKPSPSPPKGNVASSQTPTGTEKKLLEAVEDLYQRYCTYT